jgi:nitric oxide reductase NorD protein
MEIDEKLFHFAWKTKRRFSKKKLSDHACQLNSVKTKLGTIACAFFGKTIHVKEAESVGGFIGNSLFLPKVIDYYDDHEENYYFYLTRIIYDSIAFQLGFVFKFNILSSYDHKFMSLLCAPSILEKIKISYPKLNKSLIKYIVHNPIEFKLSLTKRSSESFFNTWQHAIIDSSILDSASISKDKIELIKRLISYSEMNPTQSIDVAKKHITQIKAMGIDHKIDYTCLDIFSNLPTTAQQLTIKKSSDSVIKESESEEEKTLKHSKTKERIKNIELDENDPDCNPASLLMEGVQTADIFSGGRKMVDGSDEMDDHFEAIEDLDMREVTRSTTQTQSIFKAEISVDIQYEDQEDEEQVASSFPYDEWDYKNKKYKRNWCYLNEITLNSPEDPSEFTEYHRTVLKENQNEIHRLKKSIGQILVQRRPKNRQLDGPEIDIDALINSKSDILSGHTPNPNLYISKRRTPSDISVLILIDSSLSSDSWVKGRRVLDIAKDSLLVMQEVLEGIFDNIMVASFYSNTRKNCSYNVVKNFDESWPKTVSKLAEVKPNGYTRIGVALRHSFYHLDKVNTKKKVVLLLSDGKPTDYDAYEGKWGISDVKQCVREGNTKDINIYSLAIDKDAKFYFPQLFGPKNYEILSSPKTLPEQLINLFSKII